jgi:NAD(P)-dependent dehydrogenase (short-subunit alcohol dehydrogenase family)
MHQHPALSKDKVAVVTGAADGIGLAATRKFLAAGMRVCMADIDADKLAAAAGELEGVVHVTADVSELGQLESLREQAWSAFGQVDVLMNNAGTGRPNGSWTDYDNWKTTLGVNLWGVINGLQTFTGPMIEQGTPGLIINTGSKQGITSPPGNPAYNVSKAGIKAATEALQHELRNTEGCQISAHLLVPGFTYTGMMRPFLPEQPPAAWGPEQVADFMVDSINRGDFYILCPDNDVDRTTDNKRMEWAMGDLINNRTPLSRWDPNFAAEFEAFMES